MFGTATSAFGLFSGGGSSMQVQESTGAPLSFPLSTWCGPEMDEALGAPVDAWRDPAVWSRWETTLLASLEAARAALRGQRLGGAFVLTAMNHVASTAAGFAETRIRAGDAVTLLQTALKQFRDGHGEPYASFVAGRHAVHPTVHAWYSSRSPEHLARVGAMHIHRLALVLERLFEADALLYAPPGTDTQGARLDCEWTLECFEREAAALSSVRVRVPAPEAAATHTVFSGRPRSPLLVRLVLGCTRSTKPRLADAHQLQPVTV